MNLWEFEYEPTRLDQMVLHPDVRSRLSKALADQPNIMLTGIHGCGKGTFVNIFKRATGFDFLKINGSDETGVGVMREKVKSFATAGGFGELKIVYINEADWLSLSAQAMLRDLEEQVHNITRFIFACNYENKIMDELKSRFRVIHFLEPPIADIGKRLIYILKDQKISYDTRSVANVVKQTYPDIRKAIITLQENTFDGTLAENIKVASNIQIYDRIFDAVLKGDPNNVRQMLRSNPINYNDLYQRIYDILMTDESVTKDDFEAILIIGEHSYRNEATSLKEINFLSMMFKMLDKKII